MWRKCVKAFVRTDDVRFSDVVTFEAYHKMLFNQRFQREMYCCLCWMMTRYKIYFLCAITCKIRPSRIEISFWHVFLFPKDENAVKGMKVQRCCWDATWIACGGGQHRQMGGTEMHPTVGVAVGPVYKLQRQSTWNRTIPACNWVLHCYIPSLDTFG